MSDAKKRLTQHLRVSEAESKAFSLEIQRFVERTLRKILSSEKLGTLSPELAARQLSSLFDELERRGLREQIGSIKLLYADEVAFIENELKIAESEIAAQRKATRIFTDIDRATIEAIVNVEEQKMLMNTGATVSEIQSSLMRTAITGEPLDVESLLVNRMDALSGRIETLANTGLAGFQRTVLLSKAQELGFTLFQYFGPNDSVIRPFCEACIEGRLPGLERDIAIYSIEEISRMDNGQGLPVMQYGGGYNCRHHWSAISEEKARAKGFE